MPPSTAVELPAVKNHISRKYSTAVPSASLLKKQTRNQESIYVPISTTERVHCCVPRWQQSTRGSSGTFSTWSIKEE
ncbi:hypothetical protein PQX77_007942 [Marasmius sp. AFHP31]|nr:hypothetical protein PQX77_007942 [Marasmius sp. AFHP31]